jgi:uncharacterized membrane protein (DUF2068 family)
VGRSSKKEKASIGWLVSWGMYALIVSVMIYLLFGVHKVVKAIMCGLKGKQAD